MAERSTKRVVLLGATGTIGRAVAAELVAQGHGVICPVRPKSVERARTLLPDVEIEPVEFTKPKAVQKLSFWKDGIDVLISCAASRTGLPRDARAVDYGLNKTALDACLASGVRHFVMLSAICVQRPQLAFQEAKLAFENDLKASGLTYSIVRPTAFFKSLSGQVDRLREGKPFLIFGNGKLTACKPISDRNLAQYIVSCIDDTSKHNQILPIGGPGPALTPKEQGLALFEALGLEPKFRSAPPSMLLIVSGVLQWLGFIVPRAERKAELAKIGYYYATESMLVWDETKRRYDAEKTPEFGQDHLADFYARLARGELEVERGDHALF